MWLFYHPDKLHRYTLEDSLFSDANQVVWRSIVTSARLRLK